MKYFTFITLLIFSSCSSLLKKTEFVPITERTPAQESTCTTAIKNILMSKDYESDLIKALAEKNLLTFTQKKILIQHPKLEWINKTKKSLSNSIRNWNSNLYPSFYLNNEEDIIPTAKKYSETLEKFITGQLPLDQESVKTQKSVNAWIKSFENYKSEMDKLLEERISLQYNISLLSKLKLNANESRDIQISIMRDGILKNEIITFRKDDKNLKFTINKLKKEMSEFDGKLIKNGKIKDRIIRQAMLLDILNIVHRELEYFVKNKSSANEEMIKELEKLTTLIKNTDYAPTTYGVYKIDNKIFINEVMSASKLGKAYQTIKDPINTLKTIAFNFFKNKSAGTEAEKIGILQKIYSKVSNITPLQVGIAGGSVVVAGIGVERYFAFKNTSITVSNDSAVEVEIGPDDQAHQVQLEETKKIEIEKNDSHTQTIETSIEELTDQQALQ